MRVSHFASIQVIVPPSDYRHDGGNTSARLKTVGMAQSLRIDDQFGTRSENVLGSPLPVLAPGFQLTNINIDKATIDGADFRNLGAFNPLWGHVGKTYLDANTITTTSAIAAMNESTLQGAIGNEQMYPFMFILAVKNRVANSYTNSNIDTNNLSVTRSGGTPRSNTLGIYACVLQNASVSLSSQQAIILDSVTAVARPLLGTWLTQAVRNSFNDNGIDPKNGMRDFITAMMYGYRP